MRSFVFTGLILSMFGLIASGGWIDEDTPVEYRKTASFVDGESYELVFSDEFEVEGRKFNDGEDTRWTSIDKNDYTNFALHYYKNDLVTTSRGYLNISTIVEDVTFTVRNDFSSEHSNKKGEYRETKNYQSGMIQGWNKFCFTGGIVEISARLPGRSDVGGLWPAIWLLGNLARATYVSSSNNVWPWSYSKCDRKIQKQQLISGCNAVNHYDLLSYQGRGAPEIDIFEVMPGKEVLINTKIEKPYMSTSFQVAPAVSNYRPVTCSRPEPSSWYDHGLEYGPNTSLNIFFYGMNLDGVTKDRDYVADAISANTGLESTHFEDFHTYRLEWQPGESDGYLKWYSTTI